MSSRAEISPQLSRRLLLQAGMQLLDDPVQRRLVAVCRSSQQHRDFAVSLHAAPRYSLSN